MPSCLSGKLSAVESIDNALRRTAAQQHEGCVRTEFPHSDSASSVIEQGVARVRADQRSAAESERGRSARTREEKMHRDVSIYVEKVSFVVVLCAFLRALARPWRKDEKRNHRPDHQLGRARERPR